MKENLDLILSFSTSHSLACPVSLFSPFPLPLRNKSLPQTLPNICRVIEPPLAYSDPCNPYIFLYVPGIPSHAAGKSPHHYILDSVLGDESCLVLALLLHLLLSRNYQILTHFPNHSKHMNKAVLIFCF